MHKKQKELTEHFGGCKCNPSKYSSRVCGNGTKGCTNLHLDLTTPDGMHWLYRQMEERGLWEEFYAHLLLVRLESDYQDIMTALAENAHGSEYDIVTVALEFHESDDLEKKFNLLHEAYKAGVLG